MADADSAIDGLDTPTTVTPVGDTRTPRQRADDANANSDAKRRSTPIGVPSDYRIRRSAPTSSGSVYYSPHYVEDDEWMFLRNGAGPDTIASVNVLMAKAGLVSEDIALGSWLDKSATAFKQVLAYANRKGVTWDVALQELAASGDASGVTGGGGGGPTRAPFQARLSNPDDIKEVFKQSAYNMLGGKGFVDDAQLEGFVRSYQEKEVQAQRAAYGGATVVDAPQMDTAALAALKETDPDGYQAAQFSSYAKLLEGLVGGVSG